MDVRDFRDRSVEDGIPLISEADGWRMRYDEVAFASPSPSASEPTDSPIACRECAKERLGR